MKKWIYGSLFLYLLLAGCTSQAETKPEKQQEDYRTDYTVNHQVTDDTNLKEQEDTVRSRLGVATLENASFKVDTYNLGNIKLTVHETKILQLTPSHSMIDYFHGLTDRTTFPIAKVFVTIENTGKKKIQFAPFAVASLGKQMWTHEQEVYLDNLNGTYLPGEIKRGNLGVILHEKSAGTIQVKTTDVLDEKSKKIQKAADWQIILPK